MNRITEIEKFVKKWPIIKAVVGPNSTIHAEGKLALIETSCGTPFSSSGAICPACVGISNLEALIVRSSSIRSGGFKFQNCSSIGATFDNPGGVHQLGYQANVAIIPFIDAIGAIGNPRVAIRPIGNITRIIRSGIPLNHPESKPLFSLIGKF